MYWVSVRPQLSLTKQTMWYLGVTEHKMIMKVEQC